MFPLHCDATGYEFKRILHIHAEEDFHRDDGGGELAMLLQAILQVFLLLLLLRRMETLPRRLVSVREGFSVHCTHVVNNVRPSMPEVADQQVFLLL